ncbi:AraC family transcriptional regulator [Paenibacillus sp. CCS19]|uniref:AraC family transcriptional regulator n=1 Tax=Paenibacillus sp. CCS19 TaxID=3158387 RepID=UPI002567F6E7|nr:AraC family transcriptional regulator [Paenibacillus cellulosilyticus]GMK40439.1 AraC family transcriptional regulator [Paenibacillus cellulosilyticus]
MGFHYHAKDQSFRLHHTRDERPNLQHFFLHYEQGYEIYMFVSGAGSFTIEGSLYDLEPYSILMMNHNELHALNIDENLPYERIVLSFNESIMPPILLSGVDLFRSIKYRKLGQNNQIPADQVRSSGLLDLMHKLMDLLKQPSAENEFVAKCVIVQMLHTMNSLAENGIELTAPTPQTTKIHDVIAYINDHLDQPLALDELSHRFYVTKYHLCRIFREATGFSINQYITYKRVHKADEFMRQGYPMTKACFLAGFNSYSNFYRSYRKLTGKSPRDGKSE